VESGWGRYIPVGSNNPIGYHWINGFGWQWVSAREGMSGNAQRYRVFRDFADAARAWLYLVNRSTIREYVNARETYFRLQPADHEPQREAWIRLFSRGYCPLDARHGYKVEAIYRRIKREM
jgi:hypothetical protein